MPYSMNSKTKKAMKKSGNYKAKGYSSTGQSKKQHRTISRGMK